MRNTFLMLAAVAFALALITAPGAGAQTGWHAPTAVQDTFNKMFPDAYKVKWEFKNGNHKAEFHVGDQEKDAYFKSNGTWVRTKTEILPPEMPESVLKYIRANYPNWYIEEAEYIEDAERGNYYDIEIEKGRAEKHVRVRSDGLNSK